MINCLRHVIPRCGKHIHAEVGRACRFRKVWRHQNAVKGVVSQQHHSLVLVDRHNRSLQSSASPKFVQAITITVMKGIIGNGVVIAAIAVVTAAAVGAQAVEANAGRDIAAGCANCHGTNGASSGTMPSLAGVAKAQLVNRMQEFKSGKRPGTIMPQLAKGYTDEQIDLVGGWLARQPAPRK